MAKFSSYTLLEYITALLFFLSLEPSITWSINKFFILCPLIIVLFLNIDISNKTNKRLFVIFFLLLSIIPISHNNSLFGFLFYTTVVVVPFLKKSFAINTYQIFKKLYAIITGLSIIVWVMAIIMQLNIPYSIIDPLNDLKDYSYRSYPFLVAPTFTLDVSSMFRFHCVFDEPGAVGTYCLLFLFIEGFNIKKWDNIIILVAGMISFSFFFFLSLIIFGISKVFTSKQLKKYRLWTIAGVLVAFVSVLSVPFLYDVIGSRLEYDEDRGTLAGDNRSGEELDKYIESIRGTNTYFWGETEDVVEEFSANAGIKNAILRYGIVFIILFFVFFFFYAKSRLKGNNMELLLFMVLLVLTLYQRPGFVNVNRLFFFSVAVMSRELARNGSMQLISERGCGRKRHPIKLGNV